MNRFTYKGEIKNFIQESDNFILGTIVRNSENSSEKESQIFAWSEQIKILKNSLVEFQNGTIIFEYTIPRIGHRVDNVFLCNGIVFLLEFKIGENVYNKHDINQVVDYGLDLKYFHKESHYRKIVPILISTNAQEVKNEISFFDDGIASPVLCNKNNLKESITNVINTYSQDEFNSDEWVDSVYSPTPTIIEAAQYMYRNKSVDDISRNDAGTHNLTVTSSIVKNIIQTSKDHRQKSICFITGVPGAGKTLAGLNIANETQYFDEDEHAVFLSGNLPLVQVLQEALARDAVQHMNISKSEALRKTKSYIQIIHHFRDDAVNTTNPSHEKVVIFDEAQRSWNSTQLANFMNRKKGIPNFNISEPEFLIEYMDRHQDWATIICLIGGGQEINIGEAGIEEWFNVLSSNYPEWNVYVSDKIYDKEYTNGRELWELLNKLPNLHIEEKLHLATSARSFRSEKQSLLVKEILDAKIENAKNTFNKLTNKYPIVITRDIDKAKQWIKTKARGSERYGLLASSGGRRLRKYGIWVECSADDIAWFLNDEDDVRSSYAMEQCATEFDVQGLELDWTVLCWDADLRYDGEKWCYYNFSGSRWNNVEKEDRIKYLINSYRVLMTRARQGMVIYIPLGDSNDKTSLPDFYDYTFEYLKNIGLEEI